MKSEKRYSNGEYLAKNPTWDREDAPWKANQVLSILKDHKVHPASICDVGCGSGDILRCLSGNFPEASLVGFDISPQATQFWAEGTNIEGAGITFHLGNFHEQNTIQYDVLLMLDVFEHVRDQFTFLEESRKHGKRFVFHLPLDLSAAGVARKTPLLNARRSVGHLHFYTKDLALETLRDCGYKIIDWRYTGASLNMPNHSLKTQFARVPRRLVYAINKDWGVRLLGGETLIILAE
jgi:cyclopropane fatty-acyl-phospholipid synthase-like methyltransferase